MVRGLTLDADSSLRYHATQPWAGGNAGQRGGTTPPSFRIRMMPLPCHERVLSRLLNALHHGRFGVYPHVAQRTLLPRASSCSILQSPACSALGHARFFFY